jgi:hypothetical protein
MMTSSLLITVSVANHHPNTHHHERSE